MGAGQARTTGDRAEHAPANPRQRGGQYALDLFGCPGSTRYFHRQPKAVATVQDAPEGKATPTTVVAPICYRLGAVHLAVFAALAEAEARPVEEVVAECMADTAAHLARTRHALRMDREELAALDTYLDSLEVEDRLERMEQEAAYRNLTTPMMEAAARASDAREARRTGADDQADFWQRMGGDEFVPMVVSLHD